MNELIVVKQLPIIEQQLKNISEDIDKRIAELNKLEVTEETVKEVKKARTQFKKDFDELETKRKEVKKAVLTPYEQFEEIYKSYVTNKFKTADNELKNKIDDVENKLKEQKETQVKEHFEEYKKANNLDFVDYKQVGIKVGLSDSLKSLKEQVDKFINKILDDLKLIDTQEYKAEILVEYKQSLNVSQSITTVVNRVKAIEEEKKKQEEKIVHIEMNENHEITQKSYEQLENIFNKPLEQPKEEKNEEVLVLKFAVKGTRAKLKELKMFLENGGYDYE